MFFGLDKYRVSNYKLTEGDWEILEGLEAVLLVRLKAHPSLTTNIYL